MPIPSVRPAASFAYKIAVFRLKASGWPGARRSLIEYAGRLGTGIEPVKPTLSCSLLFEHVRAGHVESLLRAVIVTGIPSKVITQSIPCLSAAVEPAARKRSTSWLSKNGASSCARGCGFIMDSILSASSRVVYRAQSHSARHTTENSACLSSGVGPDCEVMYDSMRRGLRSFHVRRCRNPRQKTRNPLRPVSRATRSMPGCARSLRIEEVGVEVLRHVERGVNPKASTPTSRINRHSFRAAGGANVRVFVFQVVKPGHLIGELLARVAIVRDVGNGKCRPLRSASRAGSFKSKGAWDALGARCVDAACRSPAKSRRHAGPWEK